MHKRTRLRRLEIDEHPDRWRTRRSSRELGGARPSAANAPRMASGGRCV